MPKQGEKRIYTAEERARLVAEVQRLYRAGDRTYANIARELGIAETAYHNWIRAGVNPAKVLESLPHARPRLPRPYSADERKRLISEVERLRGQGLGMTAACRQLGISDKSYRQWVKPEPIMRPVEVTALVPAFAAPVPAEQMLSLLAPGGYRVEGLTVAGAAELLRALA